MIRILLGIGLVMIGAYGDGGDLVNAAARKAVDSVKGSLAQATNGKPALAAVKRIGVATIEDDTCNVTGLLKSMLTNTAFDVVLTTDNDWGPLLDEFARQVKREDLILKETAHSLRVQGVDAVLFGNVEKLGTEPVNREAEQGTRATLRVFLSLASVAEENPGSLLWSEQITGMAEDLHPLTWDERVRNFVATNQILVIAVGGLVVLVLLAWLYRRATTPT